MDMGPAQHLSVMILRTVMPGRTDVRLICIIGFNPIYVGASVFIGGCGWCIWAALQTCDSHKRLNLDSKGEGTSRRFAWRKLGNKTPIRITSH